MTGGDRVYTYEGSKATYGQSESASKGASPPMKDGCTRWWWIAYPPIKRVESPMGRENLPLKKVYSHKKDD